MESREFLRAAQRHYCACKSMHNRMLSLPSNAGERTALMLEIYYLSGYVIETLLSYALTKFLGCKGDVTQTVHFKTREFKTHDLNCKALYAKRKNCDLSGLVFVGYKGKAELQSLYDKWTVDLRYQHYNKIDHSLRIDEQLLSDYLMELDKMIKDIIKKFGV